MLKSIWKKKKQVVIEPPTAYELMDQFIHPYLEESLVEAVDFGWKVVDENIEFRVQDDISFEEEQKFSISRDFIEMYYDVHGLDAVQEMVEHSLLLVLAQQRWVKKSEE